MPQYDIFKIDAGADVWVNRVIAREGDEDRVTPEGCIARLVSTRNKTDRAAMADLRRKRDEALAASDWVETRRDWIDPREEMRWRLYRARLRDLPETVADPHDYQMPGPVDVAEVDVSELTERTWRDLINWEREAREVEGCDFTPTGHERPVALQGRDKDKINLMGLKAFATGELLAGRLDTVVQFMDRENVIHNLTAIQMDQVVAVGQAYVSALYKSSWAIKAMPERPADWHSHALWPPRDMTGVVP